MIQYKFSVWTFFFCFFVVYITSSSTFLLIRFSTTKWCPYYNKQSSIQGQTYSTSSTNDKGPLLDFDRNWIAFLLYNLQNNDVVYCYQSERAYMFDHNNKLRKKQRFLHWHWAHYPAHIKTNYNCKKCFHLLFLYILYFFYGNNL